MVRSPYDREKTLDNRWFMPALGASLLFHLGVFWFCYIILPQLSTYNLDLHDQVITVQIMGSLAPPAPAAPDAPVNENLKGPDVVELPRSRPETTPAPLPIESLIPPEKPAEIINLGQTPPLENPELKKTDVPPPRVEPPIVEQPKPEPKPVDPKPTPAPPRPNPEAELSRRLAELERKVAADQLDADISSAVANIAARSGQSTGESSELSGGVTQGQRLDPEKQRYYQMIRDIVASNWNTPSSDIGLNLETIYRVRIEADGRISASRLDSSSGNSDFDLSVERAIGHSIFPPLPPVFNGQADSPALRFTPGDLGIR